MIDADRVIERFCSLQEVAARHIGFQYAADCFCRGGGFWSQAPGEYGPTHEEGYRNDGKALEFIEQAVHEKIARDKAKGKTSG